MARQLQTIIRIGMHCSSPCEYVRRYVLVYTRSLLLKQRHMEQALQQCQDKNGPLAKAMIEMIENPPPPFEGNHVWYRGLVSWALLRCPATQRRVLSCRTETNPTFLLLDTKNKNTQNTYLSPSPSFTISNHERRRRRRYRPLRAPAGRERRRRRRWERG